MPVKCFFYVACIVYRNLFVYCCIAVFIRYFAIYILYLNFI